MAALLIVADQHGLNPMTREIYAFPDKSKGIVPIVGVDGWVRIINEHPALDGIEFNFSDKMIQVDDDHKPAPEWCEAVIYRRDRSRPIKVREYLEECYRPAFSGRGDRGDYKVAGPWQSHPRRFLRHKALIQCSRYAFGFSGIYDEDEAERIAEARVVGMRNTMPASMDALPQRTEADLWADVFERAGGDVEVPALKEFVEKTAQAQRATVAAVLEAALGDMGGFLATFDQWAKTFSKGGKAQAADGLRKRRTTRFMLPNGETVNTCGMTLEQYEALEPRREDPAVKRFLAAEIAPKVGAQAPGDLLTWMTEEEAAELIAGLASEVPASGSEDAAPAATSSIICPKDGSQAAPDYCEQYCDNHATCSAYQGSRK